ncbi:short-chain fatty acid transporter [Endozoicomonas sp. OPT23]|uniref:short-chain fatty acid transporter n=1 Tax=Endozoicomonas sp. OPT23 TaxID=2072845 RepID=UPI00129A5546|nr:short-chain fatty acid transporter [Endozoicomonas sp. OPT23]MRI35106.1 short-chain fatty acid transporter [Endozoicomonas sp. OPT23]
MHKLTGFFDHLMRRYLPDPFVLAVLLTFLTFALGLIATDSGPSEMVSYWGGSFWKLLPFTMQMVLVLVTGYVLAVAPLVHKLLKSLAGLARTPGQGIILVTLCSFIACWINWGFGLISGALFARHVARQVKGIDYRLLIASAYSGFLIWHGGLSGSVPLTIATPGHFMAESMGLIKSSATIFAPYNLIILGCLLVAMPLLNWLMMKGISHSVTVDPKLLAEPVATEPEIPDSPARQLEHSRTLALVLGAFGLMYLWGYFSREGLNLTLDIVNFMFLMFGLMLHGHAGKFLSAVNEGVKGAGGIIIQFPLYAGIMGMMMSSGLGQGISNWFISISSADSFPLFTFLSAGLLNLFIPSGGGQWAIQAPIMIPAAIELGVEPAKAAMAIAWGDAWTNMIQPFWALPALAVAGLQARDIMGFCIMHLLFSGVIISTVFLLA